MYSYDNVVGILKNYSRVRSFIERTTHEIFPVYYQIEVTPEYRLSEGNTLTRLEPATTRVPKKDSLNEELIIYLADIDMALNILESSEKLEVILTLDEEYQNPKSTEQVIPDRIRIMIERMVSFLNGELLDS